MHVRLNRSWLLHLPLQGALGYAFLRAFYVLVVRERGDALEM